jgi:non-ribosomal peptide synthetase-like protein
MHPSNTAALARVVAPAPTAATAARAPSPRTLVDIFTESCRRYPDRTALEAPDATLSYAELADAAGAVAARLAEIGVGAGDRVVIRVPSGHAELYVAILGVLLSGAAYVPVDFEDPPARAQDITLRSGASASVGEGLEVTQLDGAHAPAGAGKALRGDHDAWVIFTSGSTGTPKGVAVSHRSAAAFVDAEAQLWSVSPSDRVLAGLSVGFDASCEEIWLAWRNGAALVPAPRAVVRAGEELGSWLVSKRISVVSTVPTLVALWDESCLHNVRLLILGGEACPEGLGWRLAAGREVWNTYGPTEATVVSTAARIVPGAPITIGWALPGWEVAVMAGDSPAELGEPGELVIAGVGLGRYLDPELDAERYAAVPSLGWARAYRTGDVVRATPDGLVFVGRADDQVKVGGRRIELGELDAALAAAPGVKAAAAAVRESAAGNKLLVGYVVGEHGCDATEVRRYVARRLPSGIVPLVVTIDELPRRSSGKVDRSALPWPTGGDDDALAASIGADGSVLSDTETWLAERWIDQLGPAPMTPHSDFFAMGGTSLAAAKLISALRSRFPAVAVADLYRNPTLRSLAARLESLTAATTDLTLPDAGKRLRLAAMQGIGMIVLFAIAAMPWVLGTLAYGNLVTLGTPRIGWGWLAIGYLLLASPFAHAAMQVLATRVLARDVAPGRYPRCSSLTARLWFLSRLSEMTRNDRFGGTPFAARYAQLLGAKVGAQARLATVPPAGSLLSIGAGATIEAGVDMTGWWIDGDQLVVGEISIGAGARIGTRSLLKPGTAIGDGAEIEPASVVSGTVPAGERWSGIPAARCGIAGSDWPATPPPAPPLGAKLWRGMFGVGLLLEAALFLVALVPALALFAVLGLSLPADGSSLASIVAEVASSVVLWVPSYAILVALTLRLVWKLVRPGWHPDYGPVGWALWFSGELQETAATTLFPLYASVFTRPWMRLMGLKVGRRSEISTSTGLSPLVSFGELCQSTDDVGFCGARSRGGWLHLDSVTIGNRSFLGPSSVLHGGTEIGDDSLIGALTVAPRVAQQGTSWFGVPALQLPRVADANDPTRTIEPSRARVGARTLMDLLRLFGPNTLAVMIDLLELAALVWVCRHLGVIGAFALAPLLMALGAVLAAAVTVALKWIVIGRYKPGEHPLWSFFVWRDELINAAQEQLAVDKLLGVAIGTPLMSLYLRAMGGKVGRGVWVETAAVTEYEMIDLADGVAINRGSCLMTHLFHDRLLRIGPTRLEAGATLGPIAAVLPDTVVGAGTTVDAHSVLMRGEELPAGTRWQGVPVSAQ